MAAWLCLCAAALLGGCAARGPGAPGAAAADGPPAVEIRVVAQALHTEVVLRREDLTPALAEVAADWPGAAQLGFGFGGRTYLLSRFRTPPEVLLTLLPGRGAVMTSGWAGPPEAVLAPRDVVALRISAAGLARLQAELERTLARGPDGRAERLSAAPRDGALYYASPLAYSAAFTCNTWAAEALAAAGLPVPTMGVVFAWQVMSAARRVAAEQQRAAAVPARRAATAERPAAAGW